MALNDNQIQILIDAKDNASRTLSQVGGNMRELSDSHRGLSTASDDSTFSLGKFAAKIGIIGLAVGGAIKVLDFAKTSLIGFVDSAAGLQQTEASFEVLLGSGEKAHKLLADVSVMANKTPFEFPELASTAQNLLAYGVAVQDILPWLNRLGDLSAGNSEKFKSLALVFGQVKSAGRLMGQDLLQLTSTGIPILDSLAQVLGVTKEKVTELVSKGSVNFDTFAKAMSNMSDKGGQFFGLMDKQSTTLTGRMSTLKDAWNQFGREMLGVSQDGTIKVGGMFDSLSKDVLLATDLLSGNSDAWTNLAGTTVDSSKTIVGSMGLVEIETAAVQRAIDGLHTAQAGDATARQQLSDSNKVYAATSQDVAAAQERVNTALTKFGTDSPQYAAATGNLKFQEDQLNNALFDRLGKTLAVHGANLDLMNAEDALSGATKNLTDMQAALNRGLGNIQNTVAQFGPTALAQVIPEGPGPCQGLGDLRFGLSSTAAHTSKWASGSRLGRSPTA